jgi:hypothetical protein
MELRIRTISMPFCRRSHEDPIPLGILALDNHRLAAYIALHSIMQ